MLRNRYEKVEFETKSSIKRYSRPLKFKVFFLEKKICLWKAEPFLPASSPTLLLTTPLLERGYPEDQGKQGFQTLRGSHQQGRLQVLQVPLQGRRDRGGSGHPDPLIPAPCSLAGSPCPLLPSPCYLLPAPCSLLSALCSLLVGGWVGGWLSVNQIFKLKFFNSNFVT